MNLSELTETNLENLDVYELTLTDRPANKESGFLITKQLEKVRSTARTPDYSGTTSGDWSAPDLEDFGYDSVEDMSADEREEVAETTLLGSADAETVDELIFFPVVEPQSNNLNENALRAVISGRGSQADIPADALNSAQNKARNLLQEEFDMETEQSKEELISAIADEYEVEDEKVENALDKMDEEISPKAQNAIKNVLEDLGKVQEEIPKEFSWVYETLADVANIDFAVSPTKSVDVELSDDARSVIEDSVETLKKINELPNPAQRVVTTLSEMTKEEDEILDKIQEQVDKEIGDELEKMKDKMEDLEKENEALKAERLNKQLEEKAKEFEHLPAEKEEIVDLLKEVHDTEKYEDVIEILSKLNKESEESDLFKEKGASEEHDNDAGKSALEKLESRVRDRMDEENIDKSEAWSRELDTNDGKELYNEYLAEEVSS